jgi:diguanylate cyclase
MIVIYSFSSIFVSFVAYRYVNYSLTTNTLFRKLKSESAKDYLTGLNNVRSFDQRFNEAMDNANEKNEQVSLLMIDIDFFKKVNDTYGHHEGDIVLIELGNILTKNSRSFDMVSRNGGEEFTVILLDCHINQALNIAERIRAAVEKAEFILPDRTSIKITVSIGVANYPESAQQREYLLELADLALYQAKRTGRNKVVLANNLTSCASSQYIENSPTETIQHIC